MADDARPRPDSPDPFDATRSMSPGGASPPSPEAPPRKIGRYEIVRVLGEGGMGTVFEARQDQPHRTVALKIIREGLLSADLLRRFGQEADVLARLQHPGIAQVYDAGSAPDELGRSVPYFAMEYVQGEPLNAHADRLALGTRARLELFAKVCDAVEHAHQKGIIHRDLKPGNILVDATGQPKILDFGVARATDSDLQQATIRTDIGQLVGTVPYMSPEQVSGDPAQLDTRSDVYALGVIAYELLSGRLPYDLRKKLLHEAVRVIRDVEPERLSSIDRMFRGDVETIVARALEKDKTRRYPSAESFASDVRRYLKHEPITARPASTWYQLAKFSRRNRGLVGGIAAAFVLLLCGLLGTGYGLRQAILARDAASAARAQAVSSAAVASSERDRAVAARDGEALAKAAADSARVLAVSAGRVAADHARREAVARRHAEAINAFVSTSLASGDPNAAGGTQEMTVLQAMRNATRDIAAGRFRDDPETEAGLLSTIGKIVLDNGNAAGAESLYRQALTTRRRLHGADHADVVASLSDVAMALIYQGRGAEAEAPARTAIAMNERLHPGDHVATANALNDLGAAIDARGNSAEAEPVLARALAMRQRLFRGDHPDVAESINNLAVVRQELGRASAAESLYEQALAMNRRMHPGDHPKVANALNNLANAKLDQGQTNDAETLLREALAMRQRMYHRDHPEIAGTLNLLAMTLNDVGRNAEAESLFTRALGSYERLFPGDQADKAWTLSNIANVLADERQHARAEPFARRALEMRRRLYPGDHPEVAQSIFGLANLMHSMHRESEAESLFREALAMRRRLFAGDHPDVATTLRFLAATVAAAQRPAEAESLYRASLAMHQRMRPGDSPAAAIVMSSLAACVADQGRLSEALETAEKSVAMAGRVLPANQLGRRNCEQTLTQIRARIAAADSSAVRRP